MIVYLRGRNVFQMSPKVVGHYNFMGYRLNFSERPAVWHRFWMRVFFGAVWVDE